MATTTVWPDMETALWSLDALTAERFDVITNALPLADTNNLIFRHSVAERTLRRQLNELAPSNTLDETVWDSIKRLTDEMRVQIDTLEKLSETHWDERGKYNARSYVGSIIAIEGTETWDGHWFAAYVDSATDKSIKIRPIMGVLKLARQKPIPLTTMLWERAVTNHGWRMIEQSVHGYNTHSGYMEQLRERSIRYPWGKNPRMLKVLLPPMMGTAAYQKTHTALVAMSTQHNLLEGTDPVYRWMLTADGKSLMEKYSGMVFGWNDIEPPDEVLRMGAWAGLSENEVRAYLAAEHTSYLARNHQWLNDSGETIGDGIVFESMPEGVEDMPEPKQMVRERAIIPMTVNPPWIRE